MITISLFMSDHFVTSNWNRFLIQPQPMWYPKLKMNKQVHDMLLHVRGTIRSKGAIGLFNNKCLYFRSHLCADIELKQVLGRARELDFWIIRFYLMLNLLFVWLLRQGKANWHHCYTVRRQLVLIFWLYLISHCWVNYISDDPSHQLLWISITLLRLENHTCKVQSKDELFMNDYSEVFMPHLKLYWLLSLIHIKKWP